MASSVPYVTNDCICCAERKFLHKLQLQASREGIRLGAFPRWVYRKFGRIIIWRDLADGTPGTSLPCVICRKALDRLKIEWTAHKGPVWHTNHDAPKSIPTHKQASKLSFKREIV